MLPCGMDPMRQPLLLRWQLYPARATLYHYNLCVLDIEHEPDGSKRFDIRGRVFHMRHSGVWKPRALITQGDSVVLSTADTGFFQPEQVVLADGRRFTVAWTNAPLAKLVLRDEGGAEVLSLRMATEGGVHTETVLAAGHELDETSLLLLAFAYERFGDLMREEGGGGELLLFVS